MVRVRRGMVVLMVSAVSLQAGWAQEDLPEPAAEPPDALSQSFSVLSPILFPKIFQDATLLKEFVRSEELSLLREERGDLAAVDAIYRRAVRLCWYNRGEALFLSCFATMDHMRFGVRVPMVGLVLWFTLTSEDRETARARIDSLPRHLYPDTPENRFGDRDKLQHFFGSAFLSYTFESGAASDRVGQSVEWGEELFVVDGVNDPRDVRANREGQEFGLRLLDEPAALPSEFFRFVLAGRHDPSPAGLAPASAHDSLSNPMVKR